MHDKNTVSWIEGMIDWWLGNPFFSGGEFFYDCSTATTPIEMSLDAYGHRDPCCSRAVRSTSRHSALHNLMWARIRGHIQTLRCQREACFSTELHMPSHIRWRWDFFICDLPLTENTWGIDVTGVGRLNGSLLRHGALSTDAAAKEAKRLKVLSYHDLCAANKVSLVPMGWEAYRAFGATARASAQNIIRKLSEMIVTRLWTHRGADYATVNDLSQLSSITPHSCNDQSGFTAPALTLRLLDFMKYFNKVILSLDVLFKCREQPVST